MLDRANFWVDSNLGLVLTALVAGVILFMGVFITTMGYAIWSNLPDSAVCRTSLDYKVFKDFRKL